MTTKDPEFLNEIRKLNCLACGRYGPSEAHHVETRRHIGDEAHNLIPLCAEHHRGHNGWHGGKWSFLKSYPHIVEYLEALGWEIDVSLEVMFHKANARPKKFQTFTEE
jgi:hypothetical protein